MDTFYEIKPGLLQKSALALGFFDGVHPGHQVVIRTAVEQAKALGAIPAVVTFREHPRSLTQGKAPLLLTLIERRLELFEDLGIKAALVLSFTEELCRLAPEDYVKTVLVDCMGAASLSVGFNHRFGRNRIGDAELLRQLGVGFGYSVHVASEVIVDGEPVSSSRIRTAVENGRIAEANRLLSRPHSVAGKVVEGERRGRKIGFPTANLEICETQVTPGVGVYSGVVALPDGTRNACVINIGYRPTFGKDDAPTTEVHLLDYKGDLYGQQLTVHFVDHLRSEKKFDGIEQLTAQIQEDCARAQQYFSNNPCLLQARQERLPAEHL